MQRRMEGNVKHGTSTSIIYCTACGGSNLVVAVVAVVDSWAQLECRICNRSSRIIMEGKVWCWRY